MYESIGRASDLVITNIKHAIAINNASTKKMRDKHMPNTLKKIFLPRGIVIYHMLFFDIGVTLILIQQKLEKTAQRTKFQKKTLQHAKFSIENKTTH